MYVCVCAYLVCLPKSNRIRNGQNSFETRTTTAAAVASIVANAWLATKAKPKKKRKNPPVRHLGQLLLLQTITTDRL